MSKVYEVTYEMKKGYENFAPKRAHATDAGFDLYATEDTYAYPNYPVLVSTGLHIKLPHEDGYVWEAQVRAKSGKALSGITVANAPGTIDENYTAEIKVIILNATSERILIQAGTRFAQLVVTKNPAVKFVAGNVIVDGSRGGFGSTGDK